MLIPTLEADRLRLIAPSGACASAYQAFYTDASASQHYGGPTSAAQARARLAADCADWQRRGFGVWALELKAEREIVGTCGFWQGTGWPRELTWWLLPRARGVGLALEASRAAVRHAYASFGWPEVHTCMRDDNAAARALAFRLGGHIVGRQRFPDGVERDLFLIPQPDPR